MPIRKFIQWLSFHPSPDEIARALVTDFLSEFAVSAVRFGRINSDDSATVLGQYGYADADLYRGRVVPGSEWRAIELPEIDIITGKNKDMWTPNSKACVVVLRDRGIMMGHIVIEFSHVVLESDKPCVRELVEDFCLSMALYISFLSNAPVANSSGSNPTDNSRDAQADELTQRQILILRGMVEGKTNHELAMEMGFSVSTIRHETMRIYQALAVNDRKEAGKKALLLSLI